MPSAGFWPIESGEIRFGRDGHWYSDDEPIPNPRIALLFARHLCRREDGWWIIMGDERAPVTVEDTPWVVVRVDGSPEDGFTIGLNDQSSENLFLPDLQMGENGVLYAPIRDGAHRVRFLRAPQAELLSHAQEHAGRFLVPGPAGEHADLGATG